MAIIKKPGEEQAGGVPVIGSSGGGRAVSVAGGGSAPASTGRSAGGGGPGFVNISRMMGLNASQGRKQASDISREYESRGQAVQSSVGELGDEFNTKTSQETQASGVGNDGQNGYNDADTGSSSMNHSFASHQYNAPDDLRGANSEKYDNTAKESAGLGLELNSLNTNGGLQNKINSTYGANTGAYGGAFDAALTRQSGQRQISDLQNRYGNIYNTLSSANSDASKRATDSRNQAVEAQKYHTEEAELKDGAIANKQRFVDGGGADDYQHHKFVSMKSPTGRGGSSDIRDLKPVSYGDYLAGQEKEGKPALTEEEFKTVQARHIYRITKSYQGRRR